ncbi:MAG: glycosyltransferase family 4 protein [Chloroflexota bacterium]|nr:glycosyltransferase family 4 protein [Chloroflexota bacterium]
MHSKRVLFFLYVFYPDTASSSLLFADLLRTIARDGVPVTVFCGFPSKASEVSLQTLPRREIVDGMEIVRCGFRIDAKRGLLARALGYSSYLGGAALALLIRGGRNATVIGTSEPPFLPIVLWAVSLLRHLRYQVVILDVYPDGLVALGKLSASSIVTHFWQVLNRLSYRRAERLIAIGRDIAVRLQREYGVDPQQIAYVPHWGVAEVDTREWTAERPMLQRLGLTNKFVVQYSGNMGLWHDIETFVRVADLLRHDDRIHFLFIGKGMRREGAERLSRDLGLKNVTWLEFLPREQLGESLLSCDASLVSMRSGLEGVAVPCKLYGILAAGRPVIAQVPADTEVAFAVQEERCGIVVPPGDIPGLADAILHLANNPEGATAMGRRGQEAYRSKYSIRDAYRVLRGLWNWDDGAMPVDEGNGIVRL